MTLFGAWAKNPIVVLAVAFCLITTLTRFLREQHIDALRNDMSLSALVVTIVIVNLVSFVCFIAMFAAWQWIRCDFNPPRDDELDG